MQTRGKYRNNEGKDERTSSLGPIDSLGDGHSLQPIARERRGGLDLGVTRRGPV